VNDPTVITLWCVRADAKRKSRLQLVRMFHLWRFREKQIRQCLYAIGWKYGATLRGAGYDITGLGLPIFQAMGDDEVAPKHLLDVSEGYVFNAKIPIGVDPDLVTKDSNGAMRDQYGSIVKEMEDPFTRTKRLVVYMTMIEASTRYLREFVDSTFLQLPFDTEIASDMQGETEQRVKAMAGVKKKPNAFHILDSMRAFAMVYKQADRMAQVQAPPRRPCSHALSAAPLVRPRASTRHAVTVQEIRERLEKALPIRVPLFNPNLQGREKVEQLEDYLAQTAYHRAELEEALYWAWETDKPLRDRWDGVQGWQNLLPRDQKLEADREGRGRSEARDRRGDVRRAPRPEDLIDALERQIKRLTLDDANTSRRYSLLSGS
jgi:hypothetical protein